MSMEQSEIDRIIAERDAAIWMLAEWCVSVELNGSGWDDWDEHYKDAAYRDGPCRGLIDSAMGEVKKQREAWKA